MGLLGSIVSGLFGLGQSAINSSSQASTNDINARIARETNAANLQMNEANNLMNWKINEANNLANRQLSEYEWSKNLEMWNLQNQYNSPSEQMKRYKEAGVNPNLIYGNVSSGNASVLPKYQASRQEAARMNAGKLTPYQMAPVSFDFADKLLGILGQYQNLRIGKAQESQIEQQTQAIRLSSLMQEMKNNEYSRHQSAYNDLLRLKVQEDIRNVQENANKLARENQFWDTYGISPSGTIGQLIGAYHNRLGQPVRKAVNGIKSFLDKSAAGAAFVTLLALQRIGIPVDMSVINKYN